MGSFTDPANDGGDAVWVTPGASSKRQAAEASKQNAAYAADLRRIRRWVDAQMAAKFPGQPYQVKTLTTQWFSYAKGGRLWYQSIRDEAGNLSFEEFPQELDPETGNPV